MRGVKGIALAIVGGAVFAPMLIGTFLSNQPGLGARPEMVRQLGPLMMLAFCLVNGLLSTGERALYYSPAEIDFLFSGPYKPRQLLLFKVASVTLGTIFTAAFMSFIFAQHAKLRMAAFVGTFLTMELLYLFALAWGLIFSLVGSVIHVRMRIVLIALIVLCGLLTARTVGNRVMNMPPAELLHKVTSSPALEIASLPFRPFVMAFTAEQLWPDLAEWALLAGVIDLALLGLVLALNAQFLEASATASTRIYARIQKARQGGPSVDRAFVRFTIPDLPHGLGIGPNLWRQLVMILRTPVQLVGVLIIYVLPLATLFFNDQAPGTAASLLPTLGMWLAFALLAPSMVVYDFRADLERMEDLKTLPMPSWCLVLGEVLAPVLLLTAMSWMVLGVLGLMKGSGEGSLFAAAALVVPLNFLLIAIENLYFLWFPYRIVAVNSFDIRAIGRQMILFMAKFISLGVMVGLSAGVSASAYYILGASWGVCVCLAWVVASAFAVVLVPWLALAFERFDVSIDRTG